MTFEYLKRYEIRDKTVEYRLDMVNPPECPVLVLAPGIEANRPLLREVLRRNRTRLRTDLDSESSMDEDLKADRELFAAHVLRGWKGVVDEAGVEVPFSNESAREFLFALPDWIFTRIRAFALDPKNFLEDGDLPGN